MSWRPRYALELQSAMPPYSSLKLWLCTSTDCRGQMQQMPMESIQALDVALMHGTALNPACTPFGRNFFFQVNKSAPLTSSSHLSQDQRPTVILQVRYTCQSFC